MVRSARVEQQADPELSAPNLLLPQSIEILLDLIPP